MSSYERAEARACVMPTNQDGRHLALYGEVTPDAIDGSTIWLVSLATMLAQEGLRVSVLLRSVPKRDIVLDTLCRLPRVRIIEPAGASGGRLAAGGAVRALELLFERDPFDFVVVRGRRTAWRATYSAVLRPRLWAYLTDIPQPGERYAPWRYFGIRRIGAAAHRLLCQTPELTSHLVALSPGAAGRCLSLPPMIPDEVLAAAPRRAPAPGETLRLVYLGKFAADFNTLPMTHLPEALRRQGVVAELHMIGDKFQNPKVGGFGEAMQTALSRNEAVIWHRGQRRTDAIAIAATGHVGLSWRRPTLDGSVELSTKLLEYCALGLPVVLNRTAMHVRLFGPDYPLYGAAEPEIISRLVALVRDPLLYAEAAQRALTVARDYTFSKIGECLAAQFVRASQE
jgi:hypothetical protein